MVWGAGWAFWCEGRCRGGEGVVGVVLAGVCGYGRAVEVDLVRGEGGVGGGVVGWGCGGLGSGGDGGEGGGAVEGYRGGKGRRG